MPFSTRQPVKNIKDIKMKNEVNGVALELPLKKDIEQIIPLFKQNMKTSIKNLEPFSHLRLF